MQFFYTMVLFIAIVILILTLTLIGVSMYNQINAVVYPQYLSDCPDYWIKNEDGTCSVVVGNDSVNALSVKYDYTRDRKLGNIKVTEPCNLQKKYNPHQLTYKFDFRNNGWCDNRKWAMTNDIFWDGMTNVRGPNVKC